MRDEYRERYASLVALHDEAEIGTDRSETLFRQVVIGADQFAADFQDSADAQHLAGLCWYDSPSSVPDRLQHAEEYFRRALVLEPNHPFARLYMAYVLFDQDQTAEALRLFQATDRDFFEKQGQRWRNLKTDELILVCKMRQQADYVSTGEVGSVVEAYLAMGSPEAPVPRELAECTAALARREVLDQEIGRQVVRLIQGLGYERPLQAALQTLRELPRDSIDGPRE